MVQWTLALASAFLPLICAREQHHFALDSARQTTITPQHLQPWSLSISQNPRNADCLVLSGPEQTQTHKLVQEPGDVLVINKTLGVGDVVETVDEYNLEIIGYDKRILWEEASRLCAAIEYAETSEVDSYAEFEVVCP